MGEYAKLRGGRNGGFAPAWSRAARRTGASDHLLALQLTIGNRAVAQLAGRKPAAGKGGPTRGDLEEAWKRNYKRLGLGRGTKMDCAETCKVIAQDMGVEVDYRREPLFRVSKDDNRPTKEEADAAFDRGKKGVVDRIVKRADGYYMKVHSGMGSAPSATEYPLLPGMLIYTAESIGWEKGSNKTKIQWQLRHMQMYAGDGSVLENVMEQDDKTEELRLRSMLEGDKHAKFAWGKTLGQKFQTTLSIYDPFRASRSEDELEWIAAHSP